LLTGLAKVLAKTNSFFFGTSPPLPPIPLQLLPARHREMNDCLGSRNETNQKMLLEEKKRKTIVSTSLGEFNAGDRMT
ncbi:hypothetical protein SFRURICE_019811, partial [Spodoptera frugiperda]